MSAHLQHIVTTPDGVIGVLEVLGFSFFTLEGDTTGIPDGEYVLRRTIYHKHEYPTYEVAGVLGRSRLLFHPGNTEEDTEGCVLPGLSLGFRSVVRDEDSGRPGKKLAVLQSRKAFEQFMKLMGTTEELPLHVSSPE